MGTDPARPSCDDAAEDCGPDCRIPAAHRHPLYGGTKVYREESWPRQWLGTCPCGVGIRCNDEATATDFLYDQGCVPRGHFGSYGRTEAGGA